MDRDYVLSKRFKFVGIENCYDWKVANPKHGEVYTIKELMRMRNEEPASECELDLYSVLSRSIDWEKVPDAKIIEGVWYSVEEILPSEEHHFAKFKLSDGSLRINGFWDEYNGGFRGSASNSLLDTVLFFQLLEDSII